MAEAQIPNLTLRLGDSLVIMPEIPDSSVDMILADLPYGTTQNPWDAIIPMPEMWVQFHRIAKPTAAIVCMAAQPFASRLVCSNLENFRYDLIWRKNKATGFLNAKKMPMRAHEHILVFYRALPTYNPQKTEGHRPGNTARAGGKHSPNYRPHAAKPDYGGNTDRHPTSVIDIPIINNDDPDKIHPTQKPVALMEWLIRSYTNPGDLVLDNVMGSGTTGVACHRLQRRFFGIEQSPEYCEAASQRIARETQGVLFA